MKAFFLYLLLSVSLLAAVILSFEALRTFYILSSAVPEETVYFRAPRSSFLLSALRALWPIALYLIACIISRDRAWSHFGKIVFAVQLIYLGIVVSEWIYLHNVSSAFNVIQN